MSKDTGEMNDRVDQVKSTVAGTLNAVRERVSDALPDAEDVRQLNRRANGAIRENPLGVLFGSMAIGFLFGSLLPLTDVEQRRLGPVGDEIKDRASAFGSGLVEQGKGVIRDTVDAARESAVRRGQDALG